MITKKKIIIVLSCVLALVVIVSLFALGGKPKFVDEVDKTKVDNAFALLNNSLKTKNIIYTDFLADNKSSYDVSAISSVPKNGKRIDDYDNLAVVLDYEGIVEYELNVQKAGLYHLVLDYKAIGKTLSNFNIEVSINDEQQYEEMKTISLPLMWKDSTKNFPVDGYGDETIPTQTRVDEFYTLPLYNNTYYTIEPLLFKLEQGLNIIKITNVSSDGLGLGNLQAIPPNKQGIDYAEYIKNINGSKVKDLVFINAIDYTIKNSIQATFESVNNPILTPYDKTYKKLNTVFWETSGTELSYNFEVPQDGLYNIAFHYSNPKQDFDVFNTIKIDGEVPFYELNAYAFPPTKNKWGNLTLSNKDGVFYDIYLTKGQHTLTMRSEQEPVINEWRYAKLISDHINQFTLDVKKITGKDIDSSRTWKITRYIPETLAYIEAYETLIKAMQSNLQNYAPNGASSASLSNLEQSLSIINKLKKNPDELPLYLEDLSGGNSSILQLIGEFSSYLTEQPIALNSIYVYASEKLPKENASVFQNIGVGINSVVNSFTSEKYNATTDDPEILNVWVNRSITHVDILQKLVDSEFSQKTGTKVKVSIIPDANKLLMASAAKQTPDVALGLFSYMPFDMASRNALIDLTQFDDFWNISNRFAPGSFLPYIFNEGIYAIPEEMDFNALIYRKDVFESLNLTPPDTWQDVIDMLPELQRYGMNFYHPIATGDGYKWFNQTSPFIYQNNGTLYAPDGLTTTINEPNAVKGIKFLGDLFTSYSIAEQVPSFFNSFRYSILPVGIVNLENYILIKRAAPELEGQWELSTYPGTIQEDGSISRWYIAGGKGGIVFKDTEKANQAWEFLKWWTDHETQTTYAYNLQSTYGGNYIWLSSNLQAIADSPLAQKDKQVILEQMKWLRDVPRTPGQYLLERSLSDIWNTIVFDGTSAQVAIDKKIIPIQREMRKKMVELGFCDAEGNPLKPYSIKDIDWVIENMNKAKGAK